MELGTGSGTENLGFYTCENRGPVTPWLNQPKKGGRLPDGVLLHLDECPKILDISNNAQLINTEAFSRAIGRGV